MSATKKIVKQTAEPVSIQTFQPTPQGHFETFLKAVSTTLSDRAITPVKLTETFDMLYDFDKKLKKVIEYAKESLKKIVEENGQKKEEGLSKTLTLGEYMVEIRPTNTKLDPIKVESLIRAKGISIDKAMDQEISYKINESKLADLVTRKKLTSDELESCRHELKYNLQAPKKING